MSGISASKQDGVTGIRFTLLLETSKKLDKIYTTVILETFGNERQWSLRDGKQMRWTLNCSSLERVPRGQCQEGNPVKFYGLPELRWSWSMGKSNWIEYAGQDTKRESYIKRKFQRSQRTSIQVRTDQRIHARKLPEGNERITWIGKCTQDWK